jgi:hypothetical protein
MRRAIDLAIMELGDKASTMTEAEWKGFCGICVPEWQVRRCGIIKDEVFLQIERRLVEQRKRAREMLLGAGRADLVIQFNKKFGRSIIISAARGRPVEHLLRASVESDSWRSPYVHAEGSAPRQAQGGEGAEAEGRQGLPCYPLKRFTAVKDLFEGWRWLQLGVA